MTLNQNLMPDNAPITEKPATDPYSFGADNERGVISDFNVRDLSFSKAQGGTATLGGTANGNGLLIIKNSLGSVIVQGDSDGLTVYDGSIVIKNSGGTVSFDGSGVVSSSNFQGVSVFSNSNNTTSSTTLVDLPNSTLTPLVLPRSTRVLCFFFAYGWNSNWIPAPSLQDGVEIKYIESGSGSSIINNFLTGNAETYYTGSSFIYTMHQQSVYRQQIVTLAAGTYNFKLQYRTEGSGTALISSFENGYIVLGT